MSLVKKVSDIKKINASAEQVYNFLSDFEKVSELFEEASDRIPEEEKQKISEHIEDFTADKDSCKFTIKNFGRTGLSIVDREPSKTIKYQADSNSPVPVTLWVQLVEVDANDTRLRVTMHTELNMMMKMMVKNKLDKGVNQLAEALTMIPY
ncbi:polyketide cyclase/dehydrase/lipid transport protein [Balneicella halophila]|uniref:Polyketide cyclase/dehydrase/lipid transport protein n=1 Tax=Balneicella halophila TaxID=1537566 RepID=A0A7L4UN47_BALHA|nr:SRPBCC family protein [Balneicella halophila]PVX50054.1 polyketide cyclase/dehydrase/lipid transport protein [Balneicella halophila]